LSQGSVMRRKAAIDSMALKALLQGQKQGH
jgi:hypothetical protein